MSKRIPDMRDDKTREIDRLKAEVAKQKSINRELRKDLLHSGRVFAGQRDLRKQAEAELKRLKEEKDAN